MSEWGRDERKFEVRSSKFETGEGSGLDGEGMGSDIGDAI
jgi:hypothetical protein